MAGGKKSWAVVLGVLIALGMGQQPFGHFLRAVQVQRRQAAAARQAPWRVGGHRGDEVVRRVLQRMACLRAPDFDLQQVAALEALIKKELKGFFGDSKYKISLILQVLTQHRTVCSLNISDQNGAVR